MSFELAASCLISRVERRRQGVAERGQTSFLQKGARVTWGLWVTEDYNSASHQPLLDCARIRGVLGGGMGIALARRII